MTPQERQLVDDLFDRLSRLEAAPRDAAAERVIADGLERAPNAVYALVQTVLVQDEALKRADARIRELSGEGPEQPNQGFLDSMREAFTGRVRTSVPSVRGDEPDVRWNRGGALGGAPAQAQTPTMQGQGVGGGGSFLGTAAATAAGVIGGALLMNSIASLLGHRGGSALADTQQGGGISSPWDSGAAGSDLAREAGANDIGGTRHGAIDDPQAAGLFGGDADAYDDVADSGDFDGGDFGGDVA
ncbi:MAG: DUF2076 domain-containing protein [Pseudolabrys sp.]